MTIPFPFQQAEVDAHWEKPAWGHNWDPGTGKTLCAILTAARLEAAGRIEGMLVVAPNGVHRNWVTDELPKHLPEGLAERTRTLLWLTSKAGTKKHAEALAAFLKPLAGPTQHRVFRILVISYDALMTEACAVAVKKFLQAAPRLLVLDESHLCKSADAKRTKRVLAMAAYAPYRRILTGTLVPDKPFDVYSQVKFLDPEAWRRIGCGSAQAFRAQFGVWEQRWAAVAGRMYPQLLSYRNLDQMQRVVSSLVSRVRKEDVLSELPPKVYSRRYFELSVEQRRVYRELRDEAMSFLASGELITAPLVITRMMRMQQVTSGYLPADEGAGLRRIGDENPRLDCLLELVEEITHQAIIWAKYRQDITDILAALRVAGLSACRYDGECDAHQAAESIERFRSGDAQFFVSNPAKGGTGLTLNEAKTMAFYNTGHKLADRIQAEARPHRIGQEASVRVVDLVGMLSEDEPTLDLGILRALDRKRVLAAQVVGDEIREWLFPAV
jgi:SNF2 family DNA or RNA helicase